MNRINTLFHEKQQDILSIYFTAGFPELDDTRKILDTLQQAGADLVEVGIPYSDPVADGPTIQESNQVAIENGMTIKKLFQQLEGFRDDIDIPLILMGYLNPIMQFGLDNFCAACNRVGVDGLIIPDLPLFEYHTLYHDIFEQNALRNIFLITPQTPDERVLEIDRHSDGFIYMVSSASITGARNSIEQDQVNYFERINHMNLTNPRLIGFGISNKDTFQKACSHASGAIIGSAFIKLIEKSTDLSEDITAFIASLR